MFEFCISTGVEGAWGKGIWQVHSQPEIPSLTNFFLDKTSQTKAQESSSRLTPKNKSAKYRSNKRSSKGSGAEELSETVELFKLSKTT